MEKLSGLPYVLQARRDLECLELQEAAIRSEADGSALHGCAETTKYFPRYSGLW
jgi:hypothetical protein